jgi:3,4-dihydroxy 2-butanone 4-phosphate synthase/GTP cyclohydrolase II
MPFNTIEEIVEDIRQGRMVVIVDDEDRENEGDLVMAATRTRAEDINFMARFGRGLICLTLTSERCRQLRLPLMVEGDGLNGTNFTISVEAANGVTTGISAADRAQTIRAAVATEAKPEDLVQPGHIFPLKARDGGVLTRAGHTEAGCDLARLAGLEAASVIVEILNDDGSMARRPDLEAFAECHGLKIGTIADLIHYRVQNERTIERINECNLPTEFGQFRLIAFQDTIDSVLHLALTMGEISGDVPTLVRVHMQNTLCDLFASRRSDCGWPLRSALERIAQEGSGVIVLLRQKEDDQELVRRIRNYQIQDSGGSGPSYEMGDDLRTYGLGAQILSDLGVRRMRVLSAPKRVHALSGFDMEVVEYVACE